MNVLVGNRNSSVTGERNLAGQHFKQHDANGIDVCSNIDLLALSLLRGEVGRCAQDGCCSGDVIKGFCHSTGNTEVENLHLASTREHDVVRFDIAVNDAFVVGKFNCRKQFLRHTNCFRNLEGSAGNEFGELQAIHVFHDEERIGVLDAILICLSGFTGV